MADESPEYNLDEIPHFTIRPSRMIKGQRVEFTYHMCNACSHQIGAPKTTCKCDGICHPIKEAWDEEKEQRREARANRSANRKSRAKKKPPKQYNDLGRMI